MPKQFLNGTDILPCLKQVSYKTVPQCVRGARARWVLRELEIQQWHDNNPGQILQHAPVSDPTKVNLEHIMPKKPSEPWKPTTDQDESLVDDCRNLLGNLCLLDKPSNKAQGAKGFGDKLKVYRASGFLLTQ